LQHFDCDDAIRRCEMLRQAGLHPWVVVRVLRPRDGGFDSSQVQAVAGDILLRMLR
jgi:hypothetical protein